MNGVVAFYEKQAQARASTIPWLAQLQSKALSDFKRCGFPGKQHEDWKYTAVDAFLQQEFTSHSLTAGNPVQRPYDLPYSPSLTLDNAQVFSADEWMAQLPDGVLVKPLSQLLQQQPEFLKPWLGQLLRHEQGFQALNSAMLDNGVVIYLPAGLRLEQTIVLRHWQDKANQAVHGRHLIIAEAGSQATIIEDYQGANDCVYFTNTVTEVFVGAGAAINHYKLQREGLSAVHIGHLVAKLAKDSQLNSHSLSLGGKLVRSDLSIYLEEEQAQVLMNGLYAPGDKQHVDHHTTVYHQVPNCRSEQDYKGILTGHSRAVFNGKVIVAKDAQKTQAHQQNKNLLLSAQAEIDTKPQLEIFADDVICSHGATVGHLDQDALFYLTTRGISPQDAARYLIEGFTADNLRLVPDRQLAEWMAVLINQHLR